MEASFLKRQKARIEARIMKYMDKERIQDELLSGDVSAYTRYKQDVLIPILKKALERIKTGEYGVCLKCDKHISKERLEKVPAAEYCIKCAK